MLSSPARILLLAVATFACANCATIRPHAQVSLFGELDPEHESEIMAAYDKSDRAEEKVSKDTVKVLVDSLPAGLETKEGVITVNEGYEHQVLAKFEFRNKFTFPIGFVDYDEGWRKALCYPQTVLGWVTSFAWFVVPTAYPCFGTIDMSREALVARARRLGQAAGGDTVLMSFVNDYTGNPYAASGVIIVRDRRTDEGALHDNRPVDGEEPARDPGSV